jgi:hypothetical protein
MNLSLVLDIRNDKSNLSFFLKESDPLARKTPAHHYPAPPVSEPVMRWVAKNTQGLRSSTTNLIAVRTFSSISTSTNSGVKTTS